MKPPRTRRPNMLKNIFPTLTRVRFTIQLIMLFVTVYGGVLLGNYVSDRVSQALPSLACAYDKQTGDQCILIFFNDQANPHIDDPPLKDAHPALKIIFPTLTS